MTKPDVYLPSAGLHERRATLHTYSHSSLILLQNEQGFVTGMAHWFRCCETGKLRRYGFDRQGLQADMNN
jgi:hypothetical protein